MDETWVSNKVAGASSSGLCVAPEQDAPATLKASTRVSDEEATK